MYIRTALAASTLALILMVIPVSADESEALYKGKVVITNVGAEVEGGTTVLLELNTGAWQGAGILDASFNNAWFESAAGASMAFMPDPSDGTDPQEWYFFHPWDLAAGDTLAYLYMGGPDMSPPIRYLPGAAGMTTADAVSMEIGDDFAIEVKGYFNTALVDQPIVEKSAAFVMQTTGDGISASILNPPSTDYSPTGYVEDNWSNEALAYDDDTGTSASLSHAGNSWSSAFLHLTQDASRATAVRIYVDVSASVGGRIMDIDVMYDGDAAWTGVCEHSLFPEEEWITHSLPAPGDVTDVRIRFYNGTTSSRTYYVKEVELTNTPAAPTVTATASSGGRTVRATADGTDLKLYINGALADSTPLDGASAPDNANAWVIAAGGTMPYMEYYKHYVGGVLRQHIEWENAATFTDLSGNGNDATPSFPTGSSDADVSAVLASMEPLDPAAAPAVGGDESGGLAGDLPDEPDNMYDELAVDHLPGAAVVNALLDAGDIPQALFWFMFVFLGIIIACLFMYRLSHSLFAMSLVAGAGLLFASRIGIVPFWVTVPVILVAAAVLIKEKMSPL